jgi:hypothetical protein
MAAENWKFDAESSELDRALRALFKEARTKTLSRGQTHDLQKTMVSLQGKNSWREEVRLPRFPSGSIGFMVPSTCLHINVKRTLSVSVIILISLKIPIAAIVALLGQNKMGVAKLSPTSGEFCNYCVLHGIGSIEQSLAAERIEAEVAGRKCRFPDVGCKHMSGVLCGITQNVIGENKKSLLEKGAFEIVDGECRCVL